VGGEKHDFPRAWSRGKIEEKESAMTSLSPQNEQLLRDLLATGRYRSEEEAVTAALRALKDDESPPSVTGGILPPQEWIKEFDRITASRRGGNPNMDDSRESIYGDRGL
jgi:hypothetical protein